MRRTNIRQWRGRAGANCPYSDGHGCRSMARRAPTSARYPSSGRCRAPLATTSASGRLVIGFHTCPKEVHTRAGNLRCFRLSCAPSKCQRLPTCHLLMILDVIHSALAGSVISVKYEIHKSVHPDTRFLRKVVVYYFPNLRTT